MKSRSPAPGKKSAMSGKKSEIQDLPPLDSMPDGDRNYFVGGWSTEGSFTTAITNIAAQTKVADKDLVAEEPMLKVAKELERGRFVAALQQPDSVTDYIKTNVIILPGIGGGTESATGAAAANPIAEVTHGMFISGLPPSTIASATQDFKARHPPEAAEGTVEAAAADEKEENEAPEERSSPKPRYEVTYRDPSAEEDDEEPGAVDEDGNPIADATPEAVALEVEKLRKKGSSVGAADITEFLTTYSGAVKISAAAQADPQRLHDTRFHNAVTNAGGYAKPKRPTLYRRGITVVDPEDLVTVRGPVTFSGIRPTVAVEAEPVTATRVAAALGVASLANVDKSGKPKRKTEEEKQKEAEATARLEQESAEAARVEEVRLNAFAMPDRWPTVYISNLAFAAPVTIQGAHLRFYRCHFSGAQCDEKAILVAIGQYCRVEFCECTFQQVSNTAIYAYPTSELYVEESYFTQQPMPTTIDDTLRLAVQPLQETAVPTFSEPSVAIHADAAKLNIIRSHFEGFGNALVFRNKFEVLGRMGDGEEEEGGAAETEKFGVGAEANEEGHLPVRLRPALSNVSECVFVNNASASLNLINARRIAVSKTYINDEASSGYYSVQVSGEQSTPQIIRCQISGRILIGLGSKPFLHKNTGKVQIIDKNVTEAPYMNPKY